MEPQQFSASFTWLIVLSSLWIFLMFCTKKKQVPVTPGTPGRHVSPFSFFRRPYLDPSMCTAELSGSDDVGSPAFIRVSFFLSNGTPHECTDQDRFTISTEGPAQIAVTVVTEGNQRTISFSATVAGAYVFNLLLGGVPIRDSGLHKLFVAGLTFVC
jgi:hypothetical protein